MSFWEQFVLQLISPIFGSALIGGVAAIVARRYQDRRIATLARMELVSDVSEIFSTIHTELAFYERWSRHAQPKSDERDERRAEVDKEFIAQRIKIGALQTVIDAYFGKASEPGILLHRLTDLAMLRYAFIIELPQSQIVEIIDHLGRPGHSGYSVEKLEEFMALPKPTGKKAWEPIERVEATYSKTLVEVLRSLLATRPITSSEGFKSNKFLTAYDQPSLAELLVTVIGPSPP
jgi:hypothetical protein